MITDVQFENVMEGLAAMFTTNMMIRELLLRHTILYATLCVVGRSGHGSTNTVMGTVLSSAKSFIKNHNKILL